MARQSSPAKLAAADKTRKRRASVILTPEEFEREAQKPLTPAELDYVQLRAKGMAHSAAWRGSGHNSSCPVSEEVYLAKPNIKAALMREQAEYRKQSKITRDDVLNGITEAIDQAKIQADPMAQIAGWREIAKVCGFYAPETKRLELGGDAKRLLDRFESLSDQELLEIAEGEVIDAEFTDVTDRKALS